MGPPRPIRRSNEENETLTTGGNARNSVRKSTVIFACTGLIGFIVGQHLVHAAQVYADACFDSKTCHDLAPNTTSKCDEACSTEGGSCGFPNVWTGTGLVGVDGTQFGNWWHSAEEDDCYETRHCRKKSPLTTCCSDPELFKCEDDPTFEAVPHKAYHENIFGGACDN